MYVLYMHSTSQWIWVDRECWVEVADNDGVPETALLWRHWLRNTLHNWPRIESWAINVAGTNLTCVCQQDKWVLYVSNQFLDVYYCNVTMNYLNWISTYLVSTQALWQIQDSSSHNFCSLKPTIQLRLHWQVRIHIRKHWSLLLISPYQGGAGWQTPIRWDINMYVLMCCIMYILPI